MTFDAEPTTDVRDGAASAPLYALASRPASRFEAPLDLPLAVDCDGTLIRGDLFRMAVWALLRAAPWRLVAALALWPLRGRAAVKARIARAAPLDLDRVRVRTAVVELIEHERAAGRRVVLATAADQRHAEALARELGLFDAVHASNDRHNLKGAAKADGLAALYPQGFLYAGDSAADLKVWARARAAIVVAAKSGVVSRARALGVPTLVIKASGAGGEARP